MSILNQEDYNNEPVLFCSECLSLRIMSLEDTDFCDKCGSTNIASSSIKDWEDLYFKKYNHKFIEYGRRKKDES